MFYKGASATRVLDKKWLRHMVVKERSKRAVLPRYKSSNLWEYQFDYGVDSVEIFLTDVAAVENPRRVADMSVSIHARHSMTDLKVAKQSVRRRWADMSVTIIPAGSSMTWKLQNTACMGAGICNAP